MSEFNLQTLHRWKRFAASGTANTIIGCLTIFTFQLITNNANLSNALGYLIGSICGYYLHAHYTFKARPSLKSLMAYSGVAFISFALNLGSLNLLLSWANPFLAQFIAICTYTLVSYMLQSRIIFPRPKKRKLANPAP